jgi:hypothetical protein
MVNSPEGQVTQFSGVAGQVFQRVVSIAGGSFLTGVVLAVVAVIGVVGLVLTGVDRLSTVVVNVVMAFALARIAINGMGGEWSGSVFSSAGGRGSLVGAVALRYLVLNALWLVPAMLIQPDMESAVGMGMMGMAPSKPLMLMMIVYVFGMALAPPIFLIISVSAPTFGDAFHPDHWKRVFSGRLADLLTIYVVYVGGLVMVVVLSLPFVMVAFVMHMMIGIVVGAVTLVYVMGVSVNLLGRLCGFFVNEDLAMPPVAVEATRPSGSPVMPDPGEAPAVSAAASTQAQPASIPLSADPAEAAAAQTAAPRPDNVKIIAPPNPFANDGPRPETLAPADAVPGANPSGVKTALLDAKDVVAQAMERYDSDPMGAILALEGLRQDYAPHPQVLHALCLCHNRSGQIGEAVEVAREAMPLCFERGHTFLAAELYKELLDNLKEVNLNRDQLIIIADALVKQDDLSTAAKAYASIINSDSKEQRAIKGLMNVSDTLLHKKSRPDAAAHVYRYLLQHCKDSPLAEYMAQGLEEAERRQA